MADESDCPPHNDCGPSCEVCRRWLIEQQLAAQAAFFNPQMWHDIGMAIGRQFAERREQAVLQALGLGGEVAVPTPAGNARSRSRPRPG